MKINTFPQKTVGGTWIVALMELCVSCGARSVVYCRGKKHVEEGDGGKRPLKRHRELFNGGRVVKMRCKVLLQYYEKQTRRMIFKAVLNDMVKGDQTINIKCDINILIFKYFTNF